MHFDAKGSRLGTDTLPHQRLRGLIRGALRGRPVPILADDDDTSPGITPAASLWNATRAWVMRFRELGLDAGDRVVLALPESRGFIAALLAGWWDGLTVIPVSAARLGTDPLETFDTRLLIADEIGLGSADQLNPDETEVALRTATEPTTPSVRLAMLTSGSSGAPKPIALSDANILATLGSHGPALYPSPTEVGPDGEPAVALSMLPWTHAFGLLIDVIPALLSGATVVRDPSFGRDAEATLAAMTRWGITHACMTPLQAQRLIDRPGGREMLRSLRGGVVGGAAVPNGIAAELRRTELRVGYGQTEASPGICLGEPGAFGDGWIGSPIGCDVRVVNGELNYAGPNACLGRLDAGRLIEDQSTWRATGDLVEPTGHGYRLLGRTDHRFKLANARLVDTPRLEQRLSLALGADAVVLPGVAGGLIVVLIDCQTGAHHEIRSLLGSLGGSLERTACVASGSLPRTPKGDIDRRALSRQIQNGVIAVAA